MHERLVVSIGLATALAFALACSDSSGPNDSALEGDYPLYEVESQQLPVFDKNGGFRPQDSLMITGGMLRILSRGRVSIITNVEWRSDLDPSGVLYVPPETLTVEYTRVGDKLIVPFPNGIPNPYADTITLMTSFVRMSRLKAHKEGTSRRRDFNYLEP